MIDAIAFFAEHAPYSYDPATETAEQGRRRCAESLAAAEQRATEEGMRFDWSIDPDIDSSDFSDDKPAWLLWVCTMIDPDGNLVDSLAGVDFGPEFGSDRTPEHEPYARVVQAEIADEWLSRVRT